MARPGHFQWSRLKTTSRGLRGGLESGIRLLPFPDLVNTPLARDPTVKPASNGFGWNHDVCTPPPEVLDLIVDHLHDEPTTLKTCCVVSKSWVPRTRKHLFARVEFDTSKSHIELWKRTFPDPSNSPARHTHTLSIYGVPIVTAADAGVGGWVRTFHNIVHLQLSPLDRVSLVPFYGLSPTLRSLHLTYSTSEVLDLVSSFPLLEDLALVTLSPESDPDGWNTPPTSPKLTGTLGLRTPGGTRPVARRLFDLPGGLHFSKFHVVFSEEETESVTDLVSRCSDTLESLTVFYCPLGAFPSSAVAGQWLTAARDIGTPEVFLDLSKATKLNHLMFRQVGLSIQWITMTLQTVKSKGIQDITICMVGVPQELIGEAAYREWWDLDQLLVKFGTSHSIRPQVAYTAGVGGEDLNGSIPSLLPELTRRGLVDLVDATHY